MPDPSVRLDRVALTDTQLKATEIMLYRMADLIDRLLADHGVQYTKITVPYPQGAGVAGQLPPPPTPLAEQIAPRSPSTLQGG